MLLSDRDIRRSANAELKTACEKALAEIKASGGSIQSSPTKLTNGQLEKSPAHGVGDGEQLASGNSVLPELCPPADAEALFHPFELACRSKSPRLVTAALDTIQKLVAYGNIRSDHDVRDFDDRVVATVVECFQGPQTDEAVQLQVLKALLTIVTAPGIRVHGNSLLQAVRTCYNVYLASRNLINQTTAKATLSQTLNFVFQAMEATGAERELQGLHVTDSTSSLSLETTETNINLDTASVSTTSSWDVVSPIVEDIIFSVPGAGQVGADDDLFNLLRKDCFLVFRSLCKLSMKPLPEGPPDPRSHELRSKILSLQLLLGVLQNGGRVFTADELFVSAIKSYLCVALSQNGVSVISEVFELSLALFLSLLTKYRLNLKPQIEIFFREICLNILEAASSSFNQKWMVLQGVRTVCDDAQIVVDIFVNYDCDLSAANVFERLVDDLSKLAQGRPGYDLEGGGAHLHRMRVTSLECLVSILKCMVEWSKDVYVNPHLVKEAGGTEEEDLESGKWSSMDDPVAFERVKQHKHIIENGLKLFKQKPAKGLKYLVDNGVIAGGDSDFEVARFLHAEGDRLDKAALGDLLGDLAFKDLMYAYVDQMDFAGVEFVSALRIFLEGFQLPGEAQKIDRLMEKFASRFCECNPHENVFASADAAYVLAYSIIMLTTDLHSAQVKKKMTREEFIRNNRGINESEDLPEEYLSSIYDEIASQQIKMKSTTARLTKGAFVADSKRRTQLWTLDSEAISATAGALMESASSKRDVFTSATRLEHVRPMFKLIWSPLLATFSLGMQDCEDADVTRLCVEGMRCAIRIADIFGFTLERNAFVQALARFTLLTDSSSVTEMKAKNIEAIKALVSVAHTDGNYLETSWLDVLKCISQLEFAQMIGNGAASSGSAGGSSSSDFASRRSELPTSESTSSLNEANSQSVIVAVDRIFTGSKNLSGDAIVYFITALCQVSIKSIIPNVVFAQ